jgi:multimeric flavodoxin WrbA
MKLLLINSSARLDGNTQRIIELFERGLLASARKKSLDLTTERVMLARLSLKNCLGCRLCFDRGEQFCPHRDDLLALYEKLRAADGYVFASPVYVEDVNGIMKTMIDRLAFLCHRPSLYGKSAFVLTTSGIGSSRHAISSMSRAFGTWGIKMVGSAQFRMGALTAREDVESRYGETIVRSAKTFLDQLTQQPFRPSAYSLIAFAVQQRMWSRAGVDHDSVDYRYWQDSGWLDRGCRYYNPALGRTFRALFFRKIGQIISLFFG